MGLPANALVNLAEFKVFKPVSGDAQDDAMERAIGEASAVIEGEGVRYRRLTYRGPVESYTSVVNAQPLVASGNLALVGWTGNAAGRTLVIQKADPYRKVGGTLTVTGTAIGGGALVETFNLADAYELHGIRFFATVTQAAISGGEGIGTGVTVSIGLSAGYTELYSPCGSLIRPENWPIRNIAEIHEDSSRVFGSTTLLVAGTDYEKWTDESELRAIARLSGGSYTSWSGGDWVVKARLSAGYKGPAEVPPEIKGVCLELASWFVQHSERKQYGLSSTSDATGSRSFTGPPILTTGMLAKLGKFRRVESVPTARRAWSEVAA
jgi:hypothetical protein